MSNIKYQENPFITGKTKSGFKYKIDKRSLTDYRNLKILARAQNDELAMLEIIERVLGKEGEDRLMKHVEKDGYVSTDDISKEVQEIFEAAAVKN